MLSKVHSEGATPSSGGTSYSTPQSDNDSSKQQASIVEKVQEQDWQNGCFAFYMSKKCDDKRCSFRHDLDAREATRYVSWVETDKKHLVFTSDSSRTDDSNRSKSSSNNHLPGQHTQRGGLGITEAGCSSTSPCKGPQRSGDRDGDADDSSSGAEEAAEPAPSGPTHRELINALREKYRGVSKQELEKIVPKGEDGALMSMGSLLHDSGKCLPCVFIEAKEECKDGVACRFCHFKHTRRTRRAKLHPCKGKRDRYKKVLDRLMKEAEADPQGFKPQNVVLPRSIEENSVLRKHFLGRLAVHAKACQEGSSAAVGASSSAGAPAGQGRNIVSL